MTQNRQLGDLAQLVTVNTAASSIQVGNTSIHSNGITVGNTSIHTTGIIVDGQSINNTSFPGTANNTSFVGSVSAANVVSNAQLSANLSNYQTTAGLNANIASYLPTYTGVVTNCTALSNGWVWYTPLYSRIGTGYVFSDKFTTEEEALEEYKHFLDSDKMPVHDHNRSKNLTYRLIDIRNGTHEKCWHKNCIAIGLSWGFIEPLESSGLMFVQEAIVNLSQILHQPMISKLHIDNLNYYMESMIHSFKIFVAYHFTLSQRRDSKYWRYITEEIDMFKHDTFSSVSAYAQRLLVSHQIESNENGMPDILAGMQTYVSNKTQMAMVASVLKGRGISNQDMVDPMTLKYWEQKYKYFTNLASQARSHNQVLEKNIYK